MNQQIKKPSKDIDDYECGNGPRPPVPGEESQASKMTTEGACGTSASNRSPECTDTFVNRITKWQTNLEYLLADEEGLKLLFKFVKEEVGGDSIDSKRLDFYFACEGLKVIDNLPKARKVIRAISDRFLASNVIETPSELRKTILQISRKEIEPIPNIFDELQKHVERIIADTIYPAFLLSNVFIQYYEQHKKDSTNVTSTTQTSSRSNVASCTSDGTAANTSTFNRVAADLSPLITSSNLQTLHEDSELKLSDEPILMIPTTDRPMPKLTKDLLLATQKGRLEVRPQGAHGYTYSVPLNSSYNPVSRQDSERQSCSSASLTDSDVNSKDGKPYFHRRPTAVEDHRRAYVNPQVASQKTAIKPMSQGIRESVEPVSKSRVSKASKEFDHEDLCKKLTALKLEQENQERFNHSLSHKLSSAQPRVFPVVDDDDQSILDQHVSRVFSPPFSPGTISPRHLHRYPYRPNEMSTSMPDFVPQGLRHSKSIPEHASSGLFSTTTKKLIQRWPSTNIDSGISLYSADLPYKKEMKPIEQLSDETTRKLSKDESRRTRKQAPLPLSQPLAHQSSLMPTTSRHHTNSLTRQHEPSDQSQEYTYAVYTFGDEKIPYRLKIPGKRVTLKHFKEYLPKKGNYRYFFTTTCDDINNPVVQEEVINDMDTLPLYEGKVMGTLKSE